MIDISYQRPVQTVVLDCILAKDGVRRLLMVLADDLGSASTVLAADPVSLDLSERDFQAWRRYVRDINAGYKRPPIAVVTRISKQDSGLAFAVEQPIGQIEIGLALLERRRDVRWSYETDVSSDLAMSLGKLTNSWERAYEDLRKACDVILAACPKPESQDADVRSAFASLIECVELADKFDQAILSLPANAAMAIRSSRTEN